VPALTFTVSTNFARANCLASCSFGNASVSLVRGRFPRGSSNETYQVFLDLSAMMHSDAHQGSRKARVGSRASEMRNPMPSFIDLGQSASRSRARACPMRRRTDWLLVVGYAWLFALAGIAIVWLWLSLASLWR
jgi:hypothetical protein